MSYTIKIKSGKSVMGSIPLSSKQKVYEYITKSPFPNKSKVEFTNNITGKTSRTTKIGLKTRSSPHFNYEL